MAAEEMAEYGQPPRHGSSRHAGFNGQPGSNREKVVLTAALASRAVLPLPDSGLDPLIEATLTTHSRMFCTGPDAKTY